MATSGEGLLGQQHTLAILENGGSAFLIDVDKIRMTKQKNEFLKKGKFRVNCFV